MNIITKIWRKVLYYIYTPEQWARYIGVHVGSDNLLSKDAWSSEPYLITVGSHCQLTNCKFFTHGGGQAVRHIDPTFDCFGKIVIGDYVYIGTNSLVMPGVTLGDHTLVAAGSVVTKSYQGGVVLAGNPARVVCTIKEYYEKMKPYNIGTKGLCEKKKEMILKKLDERKFIKK